MPVARKVWQAIAVLMPASHHIPDIGAGQRPRREPAGSADRGPEQEPLAIVLEACGRDVGIEVGFQLVVAGHDIDYAVFLPQPQPPPLGLGVLVFDLQSHHGAHPGEGEGHHRDDSAIAQAYDCRCVHAVEQLARLGPRRSPPWLPCSPNGAGRGRRARDSME
jgi:hypothetical protein